MRMNTLSIFTALLLVSSGLFAQDQWTGVKQVVSVQVVSHGGFIVNLDSEINPDCTQAGTSALLIYPYKNGVTNSGARSLLSTALIAFSTGNRVNIMYSDESGYCWGKHLLISK